MVRRLAAGCSSQAGRVITLPERTLVRCSSLLLVISSAVVTPLAAQAVPDSVPVLQEIVVTADRSPTPLARVVAATTVITGEELRARGVYSIEDALRQVPGAAVVPTGSFGGVGSLFLRGGESDFTKVLIDGVPVNQPGGAFNFGTLTTDNIERIEVVRGPASVLYGSDAVTGVVQIFTRRGTGKVRGEASLQAGTFGTAWGEAGASGGSDQVSYSANLFRFSSDGTYPFNNGYRNTVGSGLVTVHPDSQTDLTLSARLGDNTVHFPTDFAGVPSDSNQRTLQTGTALGLELGRRVSDGAEMRVFLASYNESAGADNAKDSPGDTLGFYASQSQSRLLRRSVDARGIFQPARSLRVTAGAQAEFEDLSEFNRAEFNLGSGATVTEDLPFAAIRRNVGGYAQVGLDLSARSLVNVGMRVDDNQGFGTHFTYRVGVVSAVGGGFRLRGSVGSAFKEPSIRENFANAPFELGNPDLKPEQSGSWEVGAEQSLARQRLTVAVTYFDQRFHNLIQYDGSAPTGHPNYQNVGEATSRGIEFVTELRAARQTTVTASYTWLRTNVEDAGFAAGAGDVFVEGKPLIRRPTHSLRFDGRTRIADRAGVGLAVNYVGERDDVDFRGFPSVRATLGAYVQVDADASVDLLRPRAGRLGFTATGRVENMLDSQYQTVIGFPGRGRTVLVGARIGL
jgi:vitamin B12 transporter